VLATAPPGAFSDAWDLVRVGVAPLACRLEQKWIFACLAIAQHVGGSGQTAQKDVLRAAEALRPNPRPRRSSASSAEYASFASKTGLPPLGPARRVNPLHKTTTLFVSKAVASRPVVRVDRLCVSQIVVTLSYATIPATAAVPAATSTSTAGSTASSAPTASARGSALRHPGGQEPRVSRPSGFRAAPGAGHEAPPAHAGAVAEPQRDAMVEIVWNDGESLDECLERLEAAGAPGGGGGGVGAGADQRQAPSAAAEDLGPEGVPDSFFSSFPDAHAQPGAVAAARSAVDLQPDSAPSADGAGVGATVVWELLRVVLGNAENASFTLAAREFRNLRVLLRTVRATVTTKALYHPPHDDTRQPHWVRRPRDAHAHAKAQTGLRSSSAGRVCVRVDGSVAGAPGSPSRLGWPAQHPDRDPERAGVRARLRRRAQAQAQAQQAVARASAGAVPAPAAAVSDSVPFVRELVEVVTVLSTMACACVDGAVSKQMVQQQQEQQQNLLSAAGRAGPGAGGSSSTASSSASSSSLSTSSSSSPSNSWSASGLGSRELVHMCELVAAADGEKVLGRTMARHRAAADAFYRRCVAAPQTDDDPFPLAGAGARVDDGDSGENGDDGDGDDDEDALRAVSDSGGEGKGGAGLLSALRRVVFALLVSEYRAELLGSGQLLGAIMSARALGTVLAASSCVGACIAFFYDRCACGRSAKFAVNRVPFRFPCMCVHGQATLRRC
jgi:hypothetical protein